MYNQRLINLLKYGGAALVAALLLSLGFGAGSIYEKNNTKKQVAKVKQEQGTTSTQETDPNQLTEQLVKDFLLVYYTKTDLEENRPRYKPYMTESMYEAAIKEEESAVYQAYKGYVVDQIFDTATIYIDKENRTALAQVTYTSVLLSEKNNRQGLSTNQTTSVSVRLNYVSDGDKLLVSHVTPILITDSKDKAATRFNPALTSSSTTSSTSSSASSTEATEPVTETEAAETSEEMEVVEDE